MKIRKLRKSRQESMPLVKVVVEKDYDHEAWLEDGPELDPKATPEAFIFKHVVISARRQKPKTARLKPHESLSVSAMRRRLFEAGVKGAEVKLTARAIKAGPETLEDFAVGTVALGWEVGTLARKFGKRVARAVTRFVVKRMVMRDEAWSLIGSESFQASVGRMYTSARKFNGKVVEVTQGIDQLATV
ncbi:MAG: hypothetical protein E6Q67_05015 [Roseateles sp.]|nr:MAG: hypothetical protein E6Q67_05015 [Roseateles sp.]